MPQRLIVSFLLISFLGSAAPAQDARLYPNHPTSDAAPLGQAEAEAFAQAFCRSRLPAVRQGCGFFRDGGDIVLEFDLGMYRTDSVLYGSFSREGVQEALVGLFANATDTGSTAALLFRRDGTHWRAVQFLEGGVRQTMLTFPTRDGRTLVVSYGEGFETSTFDLQVTNFGGSDVSTSLLLDYKNPFPSCGSPPAPGAKFAQVVAWEREDRNGDGYFDLVLDVSTLSIDAFPCGAYQGFYKATLQPQSIEQVVFLFDGQEFTATPEAESLKEFSQVPQGATNRR